MSQLRAQFHLHASDDLLQDPLQMTVEGFQIQNGDDGEEKVSTPAWN